MKRKYKIVNKKRFFTFITSMLVAIILIVFSVFNKDKVHSSVYEIEYHEIEVKEGDTLWYIVKEYLPEGIDIRKAIYEIQSINGIDSGYIFPGDIIRIPMKNK